ncbi:MAG TPA: tRNA (adenosine(37)-N6)-threonylcarbamoyltransferase complex dimerization subunit type 1 TsaB [Bacteroidales bacterium]|nr:tRNA (adenosine(37)-N6)-threonylcarbamoyltransferase complex dimerization subunit type 1 TsaB [Bacteroidota bacterium]MAE09452.1 tRNA (adenosine(37)-N6)-threonylcarbamoyltransferase complex dimerization subunit type 1 TsaB [Bacteroidota bacterium]HJN05694.1 tRNA (adenosine(37)-N6)-threonylcarbamoyltransferase complex dimerization subunit type 1 TsaB [Bacteroidales bacterium]
MAKILNIESSTSVCSVALSIDGEVASIQESYSKNSHSELITLFCKKVVAEAGFNFSDLDAVSISKGPGSYTGLRIGVSTAKGFCYGLEIPLVSIETLTAMAHGMKNTLDYNNSSDSILFCPMIDARRMEVYTALFSDTLIQVEKTSAKIIDKDSFTNYLSAYKIIFAGDGAEKCKDVLDYHPNAIFINDFFPSANYLCKIAEQKYLAKDFENTAYFEPYYLKDFVAGKPKVKGLR